MIRDQTGKLKGFCYVQFYDADLCKAAITKYNKSDLKGRCLNVSMTLSKTDLNNTLSQRTVLITNLSFRVSESLLTDFIVNSYCDGDASKVEKVSLAKDERGSSKGFAFVQFNDVDTAKRVLDVKEFSLQGRLAFIKQSKREITISTEKKPGESTDRRKRDVKKEEKQQADVAKEEKKQTNDDFKNLLFGPK